MNSIYKIKILPPEQAIKIAAGEVIERPVNIIKELIENSIDAGANKITITVKHAGKKAIIITDNGSGMSPQDIKLSVAQHATSKINQVEDLESLTTFGFRGEALASINAISNVTITSKTEIDHTGTQYAWNFGLLVEETLQSHPTGTTISITNLFDNIPARQKFLKKDETEYRAIVLLFQAFCLDYQSIHFQLYNDQHLHYNCPAVHNLIDRTAQIFDMNVYKKIVPLEQLENNLCKVTGLISIPTYYRYDRNQIFVFVNHRWIKNIDITKAIMKGYAGQLPPQKFPVAAIFISIPTDQIDINIHPKKEEIKFLHPKKIESIIIHSIQATFEKSVTNTIKLGEQTSPTPISLLSSEHRAEVQIDIDNFKTDKINQSPFYKHQEYSKNIKEFAATRPDSFMQDEPIKFVPPQAVAHVFEHSHQNNTPVNSQVNDAQETIDSTNNGHIIGQYKTTYILLEKHNNLIFIDQHAAHERILYEQFKNNFKNLPTIQLIFPEFIKLSTLQILSISPYLTLLQSHGIYAEIFSDTQLIIKSTPVHLKNKLLEETIIEIISWIDHASENDYEKISFMLHEKIHTKMACSAAIKAGEKLNLEQMQQLINELLKTEHRYACPHGRPTFWVLPLEDTEKKFKRNYDKKSEKFYDHLL